MTLVLRFVFDQHINIPALRQLRDAGVDVVHAGEVGLSQADDPDVLAWAAAEDRIVVTRNCRDYAPLVEAYARQAIDFPGVLFFASSVRASDVEHHVRAIQEWMQLAVEAGHNPARNGIGWLR